MMSLTRNLLLLLAIVVMAFGACQKDKADLSGDLTHEEGWALIQIQTNLDQLASKIVASLSGDDLERIGLNPGELTTLLLESAANVETIFPCEDDDTYFFKKDGSLIFDTGGRTCFPNEPENDGFFRGLTTWSRSENKLTITDEEETYVYTIKKLSADTLILELETEFRERSLGIVYTEEKLRYSLTFYVR